MNKDEFLTLANSGFNWTENTTSLLLALYGRFKSRFNDPTQKKLKVWREIAVEMNKFNGCESITKEMCNKKFHNMAGTYRAIRDHRRKSEDLAKKRWQFYDQMDDLLDNDAHVTTLSEATESQADSECDTVLDCVSIRFPDLAEQFGFSGAADDGKVMQTGNATRRQGYDKELVREICEESKKTFHRNIFSSICNTYLHAY